LTKNRITNKPVFVTIFLIISEFRFIQPEHRRPKTKIDFLKKKPKTEKDAFPKSALKKPSVSVFSVF
jgi:hypothetical protein